MSKHKKTMKQKYKKNDIVLFKSFAGIKVHAKLVEYIYYPKNGKWGDYGGWEAELVYREDREKLKENNVNIDDKGKTFWIYDWQLC